jgi:hypothetical protein
MSKDNHGTIRENQVRDIAALLGVADFVYFAPPVSKGKGQREASGDGLLIVGERGAILQVKSRDPLKGQSDAEERAIAWVSKNARKAMEQGLGTKRELARRRSNCTPMVVLPVRASHLPADVKRRYECFINYDSQDWPVIVIIDHPKMPEIDLGFVPGVVWFTFKDWGEIQRRLRSASATIDYVKRILRDNIHVMLGQEMERYSAMRKADEEAALRSVTGTPYLSHPDHYDELGTEIFHDIINKVWPDDGMIPWRSAEEYRLIVEFLDKVPPQIQSDIGRWLLDKRSEIADGIRISSGLVRINFRHRLVFACSHFRHWDNAKEWFYEFKSLTFLRHLQALESGAEDDTETLGVAALVEDRGERTGVSYIFIMLRGREASIEIPTDLRRYYEWKYGIHNHRDGTMMERKIKPNETCPCMSGKEFGICCGRKIDGD